MIQEIVTYAIVTWAFYQTGKSLWKSIEILKSNKSVCSTSGGCSGCSAKQSLLKEIEIRKM